jgi:hypothetical protein
VASAARLLRTAGYAIFRRAVDRGDLAAVRAAAAELPGVPPLEDALAISCCYSTKNRSATSAPRSGGSDGCCSSGPATNLRQAGLAAAYLAACRDASRRDEAADALGELVRGPAVVKRRAAD